MDLVDLPLYFSVALTVLTFLGQFAALFVEPITTTTTLVRSVVLIIWCGCIYLAQIGLLVFNYCEANCPSGTNAPTALIFVATLALNAAVAWFTLKGVRVFAHESTPA